MNTHKPQIKASLHKVPHHGSPNAHHPDVWAQLLADAISVLAPYRAGVTPRPAHEDVKRIIGLSKSAFTTAQTKVPALSRSTKRMRASLGDIASNVRDPYGQAGHVRARRGAGASEWVIELFTPAYEL